MDEYARDPVTKKLTAWVTGRRFVYIDLPSKALPRSVVIGPFKARLYHKEMQEASTHCRKCLGHGHWASSCPNEEKCFDCLEVGHRRGDPVCPKIMSIFGDPLNDDGESLPASTTVIESGTSINELPGSEADDETGIDASDATYDAEGSDSNTAEQSMEMQVSKKSKKKKNRKSKQPVVESEGKNKMTQPSGTKKIQSGNTDSNLKEVPKQADIRGRPGKSDNVHSLQNYFGRARSQSSKRGLPTSPSKQGRPEKTHKKS